MPSWLLNCPDVTDINELTDKLLQTMDYTGGFVLSASHVKRHPEAKGGMLGPTDEVIVDFKMDSELNSVSQNSPFFIPKCKIQL